MGAVRLYPELAVYQGYSLSGCRQALRPVFHRLCLRRLAAPVRFPCPCIPGHLRFHRRSHCSLRPAGAGCLGEAEGAPYRHAAVHLLRAMEEKFCDWDLSTDAILGMGTERYHSEQGRHIPIIYGDYFFVEAIAKLTGHWTRSW